MSPPILGKRFEMPYSLFCSCCILLAGNFFSQTVPPDWHTGEFPGRALAMWLVISDELKTWCPRGGALLVFKPFLQDDRFILSRPKGVSNTPLRLSRSSE